MNERYLRFPSIFFLHSFQVFREIEEASERRALEEEEEAASHPGPLDPFVSALTNAELMSAKKRRRQSISISRVGSVSVILFSFLLFLLFLPASPYSFPAL